MEYQFNTVEEALEELRAGHLILTIDDPDRENEGDLICAAQFLPRPRTSTSWQLTPRV